MKIAFGSALNDMLTELHGQAARTVRLHVLPRIEGQGLIMQVYVTSLCNDQIFESVSEVRASLADIPKEKMNEEIHAKCEQVRNKTAERLEGFEIRRGIFQE